MREQCSVEDCDSPIRNKTLRLCNKHRLRLERTGSVEGVRYPKGAALKWLFDVALVHEDKSSCLTWPFPSKSEKSDGYARMLYKKRRRLVSRIVCRREHGKPPTPEHQARHLCGKGHEGCVNRHHLVWGTRAENEADKITHGTSNQGQRHGMSKLTNQDIRRIRKLLDRGWSTVRVARKYNVYRGTIRNIKIGETWSHV